MSGPDFSRIDLPALAHQAARAISEPWTLYQAAIVALLFVLSLLIGRALEPRLEARARRIKGRPALLRVLVALLRRTRWIVFVVLLFLALTILRGLAWPVRTWLISLVLSLSFAWLVVAVLARVMRNRLAARTLAWMVWIYAALVILHVEQPAAALLDSLALPLGDIRLSALVVLKAIIILTLVVWLAILAGKFVDEQVQRSEELTPSIRVLLGKVVRIALVLIGGAVALSAAGVDLTAFTIFSGAIGLGLGFGLQKVVSNFISGIIILLDKSIKPGDTISLGDTFGWTRELRARFVSVVTRDGREYLIPNEDFITQRVINWSFTDDLVRVDVHFTASYEADPHEVSRIAIETTCGVPRVEASRKPVCWMTSFGDYSLEYVLRFWIHDPQQGLTNVRGKVLLALWDAFKANGIEVPYPRHELLMRESFGARKPPQPLGD